MRRARRQAPPGLTSVTPHLSVSGVAEKLGFGKAIAVPFDPKFLPIGALVLAGVVLAACQSETTQAQAGAAPGNCRREAAESLAGRPRIDDAQAMQITGASLVRQIKPGQPVTMDYRSERVTIETDPKTGKILRAFCG